MITSAVADPPSPSPAVNLGSLSELNTAWFAACQNMRTGVLLGLTLTASVFYAVLVLQLEVISASVLVHWIGLTATIWSPRVGLFIIFALMGLLEPGGVDPLMGFGAYLHGGLSSTFNLSGMATTPIELLLLITAVAWLAHGLARHQSGMTRGTLDTPMLLFLAALAYGIARGVANQGNLQVALWESRALFYMVICYFLASNLIRTRSHVRSLISLCLISVSLFAVEGAYRKLVLLEHDALKVMKDFAYSHETVIFLGVAILVVFAQYAFGGPKWQRLLGPAIIGTAGFTLLASERRAGYIALAIAFLALAAVLARVNRRAFLTYVVPLLVVGAIYVPVFWNASGMIGQPARAVRSMVTPDPRDAASNGYRDLEKINVRATIDSNPLLGIGFGKEFFMVVPLPDLSWWPFWRFEPHHNVLWVWLKTGAVGFTIFLALMGMTVARAGYLVRHLQYPESKTFAVLVIANVFCTLIFSWVDLGLVVGRVTIWLGINLGVLSVLESIEQREPAQSRSAH